MKYCRFTRVFGICVLLLAVAVITGAATHLAPVCGPGVGSVIFLHPDGSSVSHWTAARMAIAGPDGMINWDRLPVMAVYRGHMKTALVATSHGGATTHAFGVKVDSDSYGMDRDRPLTALSGKRMSIMREAIAAGLAVGIANSGDIDEPGTGVFLASTRSRKNSQEIARQIIFSGAHVILSGGERWLLPKGVKGRHGEGKRTDGTNLIAKAQTLGYTVVYTRAELAALPDNTRRVLGVFAHHHTFHDQTEKQLRKKGLPLYAAEAPTIGEMTAAALAVLSRHGRRFLLVVEEEGTDNFSNVNNAAGALEALRRADTAYGVARDYLQGHPDTLLLTTADSDASGLEVIAVSPNLAGTPLPKTTFNGAPLDGRDGTGSLPFLAKPDQFGNRLPFGIAWTGYEDSAGGILVRAEGMNAEALRSGSCDNSDIYRLIYCTLFGHPVGAGKKSKRNRTTMRIRRAMDCKSVAVR
ncbi:MAG: alkaline phosphatase [Syntrophaceae bacterium]|nr:alkaline phosphatase [Syntrophaceae bacterium]